MTVKIMVFSLLFEVLASFVWADNGSIAYAYPISGIEIDGDLSDWPNGLTEYPIDRDFTGDPSDFRATFRVGYHVAEQSIYVAVKVMDDSYVVDETTRQKWYRQDSHVLYLDPHHSRKGSGPWAFVGVGPHRQILREESSWDPETLKASWDDAELEVKRTDKQTVYEWRIEVGSRLVPGTSLGLDHLITDQDQSDSGAMISWGKYGRKLGRSARCGDLMLVDPDQATGLLRGKIRWGASIQGPDLGHYRVRVQSVVFPDLWLQTECDEKGSFEVMLPVGEYEILSPFPMMDEQFNLRLAENLKVRATVVANKTNIADDLVFVTVPPPNPSSKDKILFEFNPSKEALVDAFIRATMGHYHMPGLSVALVDDAELVYCKTFGVKNAYTEEPVTEDTLFEAGSITKIVFAFAVNRLAERGVIDLDKPLYQYLPFEEIAHDERYKTITARHVLTHQTGFPNWARYNPDGKLDIKFLPGTQFGYSGEGFEYLGRVIAQLTGKSLERVLMDEAQIPMGFTENVCFSDQAPLRKVIAYGHDTRRPNLPALPERIGVAHSMHTNAKALSQFMLGLIKHEALSAEGYRKMLEPQVAASEGFNIDALGWTSHYGLGFEIIETEHGKVYGHGGSNGANECRFEIYEDHQAGFIVMANSDTGIKFYEALREFLIPRVARPRPHGRQGQ